MCVHCALGLMWLSLTAMIQIPAWAREKIASDFCLGSGFCQNCNKKVSIYNKKEGKIILKMERREHKQSEKKEIHRIQRYMHIVWDTLYHFKCTQLPLATGPVKHFFLQKYIKIYIKNNPRRQFWMAGNPVSDTNGFKTVYLYIDSLLHYHT